ncbi:MAG: WbqC family protein [Flavobacteriia bacterium]|nr:WbqC family protein [Flavobacteriia bacterium]
MQSTRFPISFWGPISYYQQYFRSENPIFEVHETYKKQSLRNRAYLLCANGLFYINIPIVKPFGSKTISKDVLVDFSQNFQTIQWKSLQTAYHSSPFFEHYEHDLVPLFFSKKKFLLDHCLQSIEFTSQILQIPHSFQISESFHFNYEKDLLHTFNQKQENSSIKPYIQVYSDKLPFENDLSILDAIFNLGPLTRNLIC